MPITLAKLYSPTLETEFDFLGETVHVTWAPHRYTGEMNELFEELNEREEQELDAIEAARAIAEDETLPEAERARARRRAARLERAFEYRTKRRMRDYLASDGDGQGGPPGLLVGWDVLDEHGQPIPTTRAQLLRLPDSFVQALFLALTRENQPDPRNAPDSDGT